MPDYCHQLQSIGIWGSKAINVGDTVSSVFVNLESPGAPVPRITESAGLWAGSAGVALTGTRHMTPLANPSVPLE